MFEFFKRPRNGCTNSYSSFEWWTFKLRLRWQRWQDVPTELNRRVDVEIVLCDVANGKRDLLSREECRKLAFRLAGCETDPTAKGKP